MPQYYRGTVKDGGNGASILLAKKVMLADTFVARLQGLMFKKEMETFDALWIRPCNSIHTFFMNFPLDVLFLDKNLRIVKIIPNMFPWRMSSICFKAQSVLEMNAHTLRGKNVKLGDQIELLCIS